MLTRARKILAILALAVASGPALAYTLFLQPASQTISVGQTASFDFRISGIDPNLGLGGYVFDLSFDPAIIEFATATSTGALGNDAFFLSQVAVNVLTVIEFGVNIPTPQEETITLATLVFKGLSAGTSPLTFSNILLTDLLGEGGVIATSAQDGDVTVNRGVPEPTTPLLLGLALLLMAAWARPHRMMFGRRR